MNRNDRKILKFAEERKWKVTKVPNKLEQIKRKVKRQPKPKTNPRGRTILIVNNKIVWQRKKEIP